MTSLARAVSAAGGCNDHDKDATAVMRHVSNYVRCCHRCCCLYPSLFLLSSVCCLLYCGLRTHVLLSTAVAQEAYSRLCVALRGRRAQCTTAVSARLCVCRSHRRRLYATRSLCLLFCFCSLFMCVCVCFCSVFVVEGARCGSARGRRYCAAHCDRRIATAAGRCPCRYVANVCLCWFG